MNLGKGERNGREGNGEGESSPTDKLKASRKMKSRHRNHFAALSIMKYPVIHPSKVFPAQHHFCFGTSGGCRKEERKEANKERG